MLSEQEILVVIMDYIGVSEGYLGDFSYRTHKEFYPYYCDLDINPLDLEGTTRQRFETILKKADDLSQAKILKGVLKKYPIEDFVEEVQDKKKSTAESIERLILRLETGQSIPQVQLTITNETVERAIQDARLLIEKNGPTSGVDRVHTTLHGYLKQVCKDAAISHKQDDTLTQLIGNLRANHPALKNLGPRSKDIESILNSFRDILDKMSTIRNRTTLAHPNEALLAEDEALFVIDSSHTILNYLNRKFKQTRN